MAFIILRGHSNENRHAVAYPSLFTCYAKITSLNPFKVDSEAQRYAVLPNYAMLELMQEVEASRLFPPGFWKDSGSLKEGTTDSSHSEGSVEVHITNCPKLLGVEGLGEFGGIKFLKINECPSLQSVDFRHNFSSSEDEVDMPQPGYSLDSAEESFLVEQMDLCIDFEAYSVKKLI